MIPSNRLRTEGTHWFNPTVSMPRQTDRWGCAAVALQWALESLGILTTRVYLTDGLIRDRYLVPQDQLGMVDKTGVDLAEYTNRAFGFMGICATAHPRVEWASLGAEAGRWPVILYGEGWCHWTVVRGISMPSGVLTLANVADPLRRVPRQELNRVDFQELGPFHAVVVRRN